MKKLLLLSILLSGYASSQEFEFNIPMQDKPHKVIKFSAESGKTYNWDRCSGQTTQALSEDGVACEKVINSRSGFTGSVDVCVSATKESLSDPYCFSMCQGESVTWGNCTASVTLSEHLDIKNITNTDNRYVGTAEMLCTDGNWSIRSSTCEDNFPICGSDHNTVNNNPSNLCEIGSASSVTSNANTMNWNCTTSANNIACLSYKVALCDSNTFNGCIVGTSGGYTSAIGDTTATWTCSNGSSSANCSKEKIVATNGVCGSVNGQTVASKPSTNLCMSGTASAVITNPTTHTWTCQGSTASNTEIAGSSSNCSSNREPICSAGLTWNGTSCTGTQTQTASRGCSTGYDYNGACYVDNNYAANKNCSSGYSYWSSNGLCSKYDYTSATSITCPSGYTLNESPEGNLFCYKSNPYASSNPTVSCPSGYTVDRNFLADNLCQRVLTQSPTLGCNSGDTLSGNVCSGKQYYSNYSYSCNSGWNLSGSTCSRTITQSPIGYK